MPKNMTHWAIQVGAHKLTFRHGFIYISPEYRPRHGTAYIAIGEDFNKATSFLRFPSTWTKEKIERFAAEHELQIVK